MFASEKNSSHKEIELYFLQKFTLKHSTPDAPFSHSKVQLKL